MEITVPVIFITAYDEYALKAFKYQGIDYILKPFDKEELRQALNKLESLSPVNVPFPVASLAGVSGAFLGYRGDEDEVRDRGRCCLFHGRREGSGCFLPGTGKIISWIKRSVV